MATLISPADKRYFRRLIQSDLEKLNYPHQRLRVHWSDSPHILKIDFKVEHRVQSKNMYDLFFVDGIKHLDVKFERDTEFDWIKPQVWSLWTGVWFSDFSGFCNKLKFNIDFLHKTIGQIFHNEPETVLRHFVNMYDGKFQLTKNWSGYTDETKAIIYEAWQHIKDKLKTEKITKEVQIKYYTECEFDCRDYKLNKLLNE
jgi:hypothetical protein